MAALTSAREWAERYRKLAGFHVIDGQLTPIIAACQRDTVEACAKVAEKGHWKSGSRIADEIRALLPKETT